MDVLSKEQRRRNMQSIRCRGTKIERIFGKELWKLGYRYRKNNKKVYGCPDFTFTKYKIAIFVDSEFFHGKDWDIQKHRIQSNKDFWWNKIESNIRRDKIVVDNLQSQGWKVLRFWGHEISKNLPTCIACVEAEIEKSIHG